MRWNLNRLEDDKRSSRSGQACTPCPEITCRPIPTDVLARFRILDKMGDQTDWCCKHVATNHRTALPLSAMQSPQVSRAMQGGGFAACALGLLCVFQEKLVRLLAKRCGRSLFGGRRYHTQFNLAPICQCCRSMCHACLASLMDSLTSRTDLGFSTRSGVHVSSSWAVNRSTCPCLAPARLQALLPAPAGTATMEVSERRP